MSSWPQFFFSSGYWNRIWCRAASWDSLWWRMACNNITIHTFSFKPKICTLDQRNARPGIPFLVCEKVYEGNQHESFWFYNDYHTLWSHYNNWCCIYSSYTVIHVMQLCRLHNYHISLLDVALALHVRGIGFNNLHLHHVKYRKECSIGLIISCMTCSALNKESTCT